MRKGNRGHQKEIRHGALQVIIAIRNGQGHIAKGGDETRITEGAEGG